MESSTSELRRDRDAFKALQDQVMELRSDKISLLEKLSSSTGQTAVTTSLVSPRADYGSSAQGRHLQDLVQELETKLKLAQIDLDSKEKQISLQSTAFATLESSLSKERQLRQQVSHQLFETELKFEQMKEQKDVLSLKLAEEAKRHSILTGGVGNGPSRGAQAAAPNPYFHENTLGQGNTSVNPDMMQAEISFLKAELDHLKQEKQNSSVNSGIQMAVSQDMVPGGHSGDHSENMYLKQRVDGLLVENEALKARNETLSKQLIDVLSSSKFDSHGSGAEGEQIQKLRIENSALKEHVEDLNKQLTLMMVAPVAPQPIKQPESVLAPPRLPRNHSDSQLMGMEVLRMENEMLQQELASLQQMMKTNSNTKPAQDQKYSPVAFKRMEDHVSQLNQEIEGLRREVSASQTASRQEVSTEPVENVRELREQVLRLSQRESLLENQLRERAEEFSRRERQLADELRKTQDELKGRKEQPSSTPHLVGSQMGSFITSGLGSPKEGFQSKIMMGSGELVRQEDFLQLRREKSLLEQKIVELESQLRQKDENLASMSNLVSALHAELDAVRGGDETSRSQITVQGRYGATLETKKELELLRERINLLEEREKEYLQDEKDKDRIIQYLRDQLNVAEQNAQQQQDNSMNLE